MRENRLLTHTTIGKRTSFLLTLQSMKTETPNKKNAQNMYTTLKKCSEDPDWLKAYEIIKRAEEYILKNKCYGEE